MVGGAITPLGLHKTEILHDQAAVGGDARIPHGSRASPASTGFTDDARHDVPGTCISANRQVVIKNMAYTGNPRMNVGTTVPAIIPSWGWLRFDDGSVYGPGPDPGALRAGAARFGDRAGGSACRSQVTGRWGAASRALR